MGKAWKFGENLNTDEIIPARFNITIEPDRTGEECFLRDSPGFCTKRQARGCDRGRAELWLRLIARTCADCHQRLAGAACVIAPSFARIFFRNAINIGLPILECPEAAAEIEEGDEVTVST